MKRLTLVAGLAIVLLTPAVTQAKAPTPQHARTYERVYRQVAHEFGRRTPGRNIMRNGFDDHRGATDADVVGSIAVLERMLVPTTPVPASYTHYYAIPTSASYYHTTYSRPSSGVPTGGGGSGGLPACASESGTNYSTGPLNTNSSSRATGRYQITPSTAANYRCNLGTPSGQDACAQQIYAHQGAGAWVNCGG